MYPESPSKENSVSTPLVKAVLLKHGLYLQVNTVSGVRRITKTTTTTTYD